MPADRPKQRSSEPAPISGAEWQMMEGRTRPTSLVQAGLRVVRDLISDEPRDAHPQHVVSGQAVLNGLDVEDLQQGALGDCWYVSAMQAVVLYHPDAIRRLIHDNRDGTYNVTLYVRPTRSSAKVPKVFRVDSEFPVNDKGEPLYTRSSLPDELWPMLLEKAFAKYLGGYDKLEGGWPLEGLEALTPKAAQGYLTANAQPAAIYHQIEQALNRKLPVTAGTVSPSRDVRPADFARAKLIANHAYSVCLLPGGVGVVDPHGDLVWVSPTDFKRFFYSYAISGPL